MKGEKKDVASFFSFSGYESNESYGCFLFNASRTRLSSVLSMNAAVSASVVLGSRLSTDASVFALMLFSILCFALYPLLRYRLQVSDARICRCFNCKLTKAVKRVTDCVCLRKVHAGICMALDHRRFVDLGRLACSKLIPHRHVAIWLHLIFRYLDSAGHPDLGTTIQEVRRSSLMPKAKESYLIDSVAPRAFNLLSIIRGPWDVAIPKVN